MNITHRNVAIGAALISALAWVDPLYIPMILFGPLLTGLVVGLRGADWRPAGAAWGIACLLTLVVDLAINGEDVAFHAVVTVLTVALLRAAAAAANLAHRRGVRAA
jgi:hypothetical protein